MCGFQSRILALLGFREFRVLSLHFILFRAFGFRVSCSGAAVPGFELCCLGVGLQDFELRASEVIIRGSSFRAIRLINYRVLVSQQALFWGGGLGSF